MQALLSTSPLTVINNSSVDLEALAKAEALRQAKLQEDQAKLQEEQDKIAAQAEADKKAEEATLFAKKASEAKLTAQSVQKKVTQLLQIENIEFRSAKGALTKKGILTVDKLANILAQYPNIKVEVAGHTDSDGSAIFNQNLSQKRVDTAKARLVKKGIDPARLTAIGYGESKPLVPNTSKANKQRNRRVEIKIQGE
jgi:outer membrane protein OmpA-like peptidoglycan-associated protein